MECGDGRMDPVTVEGENDPVLVDDSGLEPVWLVVGVKGSPRSSKSRGLSLPVGPFPSGGLCAGGRLSAARRQLFSSSNSETLSSNAWK